MMSAIQRYPQGLSIWSVLYLICPKMLTGYCVLVVFSVLRVIFSQMNKKPRN